MRHVLIILLAICLAALPVAAAQIPRPAPALTFSLTNGKKIDLSSYKGKVIALEFLLTTCPHCQAASGSMQRIYSDYAAKGFQPLGVAIDEDARRNLPTYVAGLHLSYPVGVGTHEMAVAFLQHSPVMIMNMPQLVLIDRKGRIRAQYGGTDDFFRNGEANLRKLVDKLVTE